uniref:Tetrapyrrole biosynthesis uroporphyrinogen III synthase domain-containing protein n=1 Tax=Davidia involucrata TaxID=16924 RepID=A0A5B7CAB7_DAVIN
MLGSVAGRLQACYPSPSNLNEEEMMVGMKTANTMQNLQHPTAVSPFLTQFPNNNSRIVAFTTPQNYAGRLSQLLQLKGWKPLWCPTVVVETTSQTTASIQKYLSNPNNDDDEQKPPLEDFSAIAFTSRTGISAFSEALADVKKPQLAPSGETFTISALGKDSECLDDAFISRICNNPERIRVLVPPVATPTGLVESLGLGRGRRVLCPVPLVIGLEEPPVVPNFLRDLAAKGWVPVRVNGYETRWAGPECAEGVVRKSEEEGLGLGLDAIVFTSTGEVEGLLKSLREFGLDWGTVRKRCPRLVVAAHGPVTASGAESLGVAVDVVSSMFDSFGGVVDALAFRWQSLEC